MNPGGFEFCNPRLYTALSRDGEKKSSRREETEMETAEWIHVGQVTVDSGVVLVGDPTYLPDGMEALLEPGWQGVKLLAQGVVVVESGYGDGFYPLEVRYHDDRVAEVRIRFIQAEE